LAGILLITTTLHPFNGPLSGTTQMSTDNHASIPPLSFYRPDALPATQVPTNSVKALDEN